MKKLILSSLFALLLAGGAKAQTLSPTVVASAGGFHANSSYSLSWTLGEAAVQYISGTSTNLMQGFQQPSTWILTGVAQEAPLVSGSVSVFPNPSRGELNIRLTGKTLGVNRTAILTDLAGRRLRQVTLLENGIATMNLEGLAASLYLLELPNGAGRIKIEKLN